MMLPNHYVMHYLGRALLFLSVSYLTWYYFFRCCRARIFAGRVIVPGTIIAAVLLLTDAALFVQGNYASRAGEFCALGGASWFVAELFCLLLLAVFGIAALVFRLTGKGLPVITRRIFLSLGIISFVIAFAGMYNGYRELVISKYEYNNPKLTKDLRIAWVSDLHMGNVYNLTALHRVLSAVGREHPDVIIIGGDLFDDERLIRPAVKILDDYARASGKPVFFVMGNHEYYCNASLAEREVEASRVRLLLNAAVLLPEYNVSIGGGDYPLPAVAGMKFDELRAENALRLMYACMPESGVRVLAAHSPEYIEVIDGRKMMDLVISGHTHGGQVQIGAFNLFGLKFQYLRGRYELPNLTAIVSNGAGSWLPFRIGCPADITIADLKK